jgi:hypothetical protein
MRKKFKRFWQKIYWAAMYQPAKYFSRVKPPTIAQLIYQALLRGELKWRTF